MPNLHILCYNGSLVFWTVDNGADRLENTIPSDIPIGYIAWRGVTHLFVALLFIVL
jgi:hypothetical protein